MGDSPLEGSRHADWAVAGGSIPTVDVNHLGDSCGVTRSWGGPWWGGPFLTQPGQRCGGRHTGWS